MELDVDDGLLDEAGEEVLDLLSPVSLSDSLKKVSVFF